MIGSAAMQIGFPQPVKQSCAPLCPRPSSQSPSDCVDNSGYRVEANYSAYYPASDPGNSGVMAIIRANPDDAMPGPLLDPAKSIVPGYEA